MDLRAGSAGVGALVPSDFAGLFEVSPNAYAVLDSDFRVVAANSALLKDTKWRAEDIIGQRLWEAFTADPELGRLSLEALNKVVAERRAETIAALRYDVPKPGGGLDERYWNVVFTPLLDPVTGEVRLILQNSIDVTDLRRLQHPELDIDMERVGGQVLARADEVARDNRSLRDRGRRLNQLFEQAPGFMCVLREPEHRIELVNRSLTRLVGGRQLLGRLAMEAVPEMAEQGLQALLDQVFTSGEPYVGHELRALFQRTAGAPLEEVFLDIVLQPIVDDDGQVSGIFIEGSDVTARVRAQKQQRLLLDELNHRVKNTLATVQSIAAQTLRSSDTAADFCRDFEARLIALSKTHDILTQGHWRGADLRRLLEQELEPFDLGRIELDGPRVMLPPRAALTLGLVFHELATNAAKYGALSSAAGRLSVRWTARRRNRHRLVEMDWLEAGGPPVVLRGRRGFGSRLIERSLKSEGGTASLDFRPEGLAAHLSLPVTAAAVNHHH